MFYLDLNTALYCHIGVANGIHSKLSGSSVDLDNCATLTLHVNDDGIPLSRSSTTHLWQSLATIQELSGTDPFVVGVFSGTTKPYFVNDFLFDFIQEMKVLNVGETGASCYNFHSKSLFHKNMPARDLFWT